MRYLGLALFAEGLTDHLFLAPLLRRACERECLDAREVIEIGPVEAVRSPPEMRQEKRERRIAEAASRSRELWQVLFVHGDGGGNPTRARRQLVEPALRSVAQRIGAGGHPVAVVPVRETEAWALADGEALRRVLGISYSDEELGLSGRPRDVERIREPKQRLEELCRQPRRRRRRRSDISSSILRPLGELIRLETLDLVPAFETFLADLREALRALGVLVPESRL